MISRTHFHTGPLAAHFHPLPVFRLTCPACIGVVVTLLRSVERHVIIMKKYSRAVDVTFFGVSLLLPAWQGDQGEDLKT
jgi:hypothetical protein